MDIRKIFFNIPEPCNTPILVVLHHDYVTKQLSHCDITNTVLVPSFVKPFLREIDRISAANKNQIIF